MQQQQQLPSLAPAAARWITRKLLALLMLAALLHSAAAFVQPAAPLVSVSITGARRIIQRQQQGQRAAPVQLQPLWSSLGEEPQPATEAATTLNPDDEREAAARRLREELEKEKEKERSRAMDSLKEELAAGKKRNALTAVGSVVAAVALFFYQHLHPVEAVTLLRQMQSESPVLQQVVGQNGRPTVVDFYAEWCENCKEMAPVLREVEGRYKDRVNFVVVNGDAGSSQAAELVERFQVDGIPHLALITRDGEVKTALIGKVPRSVIEADLDALIQDPAGALPYEGYDAFEDEPERFIRF